MPLGSLPIAAEKWTCPRCGGEAVQEYYGPCADCRGSLRAATAVEHVEPVGSLPSIGDHAARFMWRDMPERPTVFVRGDRYPTAAALLDALGSTWARVFLLDRPGRSWDDAREWGDTCGGWEPGDHYLSPDSPVWNYRRDGRTVTVRMAAGWFPGVGNPAVAEAAWDALGAIVGRRWKAALLASPAALGRDLIARQIPKGVEWPTIGADVAAIIREHSTQGRVELVHHDAPELPALVEYDGRWAYAALCQGLPGGPVRHFDGEPTYDAYRAGWYRVTAQVPDGWARVGILPQRTNDGWRWPTSGRVSGWVSAVELAQARKWGWPCTVHECWLFDGYDGPGPLDKWAKGLQAARVEAATCHEDPAVCEAVAAAVRMVLVQTIGSLYGGSREVTRSAPLDTTELPEGARDLRVEGDRYVWCQDEAPAWPGMVHPEWSAYVWARCRARMLDGPGAKRTRTGALHVEPGEVVAIRTDALYLTTDPGWEDDGKVGRLRYKRRRSGPIPTPRDARALLDLRSGMSVR